MSDYLSLVLGSFRAYCKSSVRGISEILKYEMSAKCVILDFFGKNGNQWEIEYIAVFFFLFFCCFFWQAAKSKRFTSPQLHLFLNIIWLHRVKGQVGR